MALPVQKVKGPVAMKLVKKKKRESKIAVGKRARSQVLNGKKTRTKGGLTAESLFKNKRGKIVSKRASAMGKRRYKHIESWLECVMEARDLLRMQGFVAINGSSLMGKALYCKSKQLYHRRCKVSEPKVSEPVAESTRAPDKRLSLPILGGA